MARRRTTTRLKRKPAIAVAARKVAPIRRSPGRPPVHEEAWTKVTVVLFDRQIVLLDRLAANIRAKSGTTISRAQLIRAGIDAVAAADMDLTSASTEGDLKTAILARLDGNRPDAAGL
jgi:hypothetical protein